ncbi:MAG: cell envelope integrity protein TolA [Gammaproteobacteria bacterium]|nr:MAG: cell envelope integrity protein TolA [Gammaproteobacteria bacterium]
MSATFAREYSSGLTLSVVGHVVLFAVLGMKLIRPPSEPVPQVRLAIEATVIDVAAIRAREAVEHERLAEIERQKQAAAERVRREQEAAQAARRKEQQARVAEQRRREKTERDRKAAEQKAVEQKAAEARRRREAARVAEQRRKDAELREREAAEERRRASERQAEFARELEAEEHRLAAISSGKQAQYLALIRNRVERNWVRPAGAKVGIECVVHVTQIPGGDVVSARIGRCNGDASVRRSIIAAVAKSSPLPPPPDPSLFDRTLRFTFKPEQ